MKTAVIVFPGSNCDHDVHYSAGERIGQTAEFVWHKDHRDLSDYDLVIVPGGFSYGDYLRCGAIARFAPIMQDVVAFARGGGYVLGICNGFQILTECGLLPGALLRNRDLKFVCKDTFLRVENNNTVFTSGYEKGEVIMYPIAHGDGNYFAEPDTLLRLEDEGRVLLRYCSENGSLGDEFNPNGSSHHIAGIVNETGNVAGMMPHPDRCSDPLLNSADGLRLFQSLAAHFETVSA
jgi:phosphoribosylformylglycinamidine synthase